MKAWDQWAQRSSVRLQRVLAVQFSDSISAKDAAALYVYSLQKSADLFIKELKATFPAYVRNEDLIADDVVALGISYSQISVDPRKELTLYNNPLLGVFSKRLYEWHFEYEQALTDIRMFKASEKAIKYQEHFNKAVDHIKIPSIKSEEGIKQRLILQELCKATYAEFCVNRVLELLEIKTENQHKVEKLIESWFSLFSSILYDIFSQKKIIG